MAYSYERHLSKNKKSYKYNPKKKYLKKPINIDSEFVPLAFGSMDGAANHIYYKSARRDKYTHERQMQNDRLNHEENMVKLKHLYRN